MTDTPQHIKELQLKIWLSKPPGERLRLTLEGNGQLLHFWSAARVVDRKRTFDIGKDMDAPANN
jgi:hypothetical protein